jgi:hypothetical protein
MRMQWAGKVRYGIAVGLLLFAGCSHRYVNALHPGSTQTDFDRDWYECQHENTHPKSGDTPTGGYFGESQSALVNPMPWDCMKARGWQAQVAGG